MKNYNFLSQNLTFSGRYYTVFMVFSSRESYLNRKGQSKWKLFGQNLRKPSPNAPQDFDFSSTRYKLNTFEVNSHRQKTI